MPVPDYPVHPKTRGEHREACANKERKPYYDHLGLVPSVAGGFRIAVTRIFDSSSRECRYDHSLSDPGCVAARCPRLGQGEDYSANMMMAATS